VNQEGRTVEYSEENREERRSREEAG